MRNLVLILLGLTLTSCLVQADSGPVHIVQPGDTLWDIALAHGISWQELASLNKIDVYKRQFPDGAGDRPGPGRRGNPPQLCLGSRAKAVRCGAAPQPPGGQH